MTHDVTLLHTPLQHEIFAYELDTHNDAPIIKLSQHLITRISRVLDSLPRNGQHTLMLPVQVSQIYTRPQAGLQNIQTGFEARQSFP